MSYIADLGELRLACEVPVSAERYVRADIQDKPIFLEDDSYAHYHPTAMQYNISRAGTGPITISFYFTNFLTAVEAKYAVICQYDGINNWRPLLTTFHDTDRSLKSTMIGSGTIAIFMNEYWYSAYTQNMADEFPAWTAIRQDRMSNGQQFLNHYGMAIEEVHGAYADIRDQKFIDTIDARILDWIYVYDLPSIETSDTLEIKVGSTVLSIANTLREFFYNHTGASGIIDYERKRLYALKQFGPIDVEIMTYGRRGTFHTEGRPHQLWNAFDEFGVLAGTPRLYLEKNDSYRERIKDVFRYVANSGDIGLTNALGRELNLIKRVTWQDDKKVLLIRGDNLDKRTVRVDGKELPPNMVTTNEYGYIIIQPLNQGATHTVSVIKDVMKYELHNKNDQELHGMMFDPDGQASPKLIEWVNYINQVAPIMWGDVNWDEGFWDTIDKNLTGIGYLPNIWDSNITAWKDYKLTLDMRRNEKVWGS